jgi:hypothetical protein
MAHMTRHGNENAREDKPAEGELKKQHTAEPA